LKKMVVENGGKKYCKHLGIFSGMNKGGANKRNVLNSYHVFEVVELTDNIYCGLAHVIARGRRQGCQSEMGPQPQNTRDEQHKTEGELGDDLAVDEVVSEQVLDGREHDHSYTRGHDIHLELETRHKARLGDSLGDVGPKRLKEEEDRDLEGHGAGQSVVKWLNIDHVALGPDLGWLGLDFLRHWVDPKTLGVF